MRTMEKALRNALVTLALLGSVRAEPDVAYLEVKDRRSLVTAQAVASTGSLVKTIVFQIAAVHFGDKKLVGRHAVGYATFDWVAKLEGKKLCCVVKFNDDGDVVVREIWSDSLAAETKIHRKDAPSDPR